MKNYFCVTERTWESSETRPTTTCVSLQRKSLHSGAVWKLKSWKVSKLRMLGMLYWKWKSTWWQFPATECLSNSYHDSWISHSSSTHHLTWWRSDFWFREQNEHSTISRRKLRRCLCEQRSYCWYRDVLESAKKKKKYREDFNMKHFSNI